MLWLCCLQGWSFLKRAAPESVLMKLQDLFPCTSDFVNKEEKKPQNQTKTPRNKHCKFLTHVMLLEVCDSDLIKSIPAVKYKFSETGLSAFYGCRFPLLSSSKLMLIWNGKVVLDGLQICFWVKSRSFFPQT